MYDKGSLDYLFSLNPIAFAKGKGKERNYNVKYDTLNFAISNVVLNYNMAEFGVYNGDTAKHILYLTKKQNLHLFDSFKGLPKAWCGQPKGAYCADVIPNFKSNRAIVHSGWFKDSIPIFKKKYTDPFSFIHIDSDLYESAKTVLFSLNEYIVAGTIIQFDEFYNINSWWQYEYKALIEWSKEFNRKFEYIGRSDFKQVVIKCQ